MLVAFRPAPVAPYTRQSLPVMLAMAPVMVMGVDVTNVTRRSPVSLLYRQHGLKRVSRKCMDRRVVMVDVSMRGMLRQLFMCRFVKPVVVTCPRSVLHMSLSLTLFVRTAVTSRLLHPLTRSRWPHLVPPSVSRVPLWVALLTSAQARLLTLKCLVPIAVTRALPSREYDGCVRH